MDDAATVLTWVSSIALAITLAASAGLRAWLPLFAAGLVARFGVGTISDNFGWIGSTPALVVFGLATVLEIIGDKIPAVDHALDAAGTVMRPLAGALVAAAALVRIDDPLLACVAGLCVGAPTALAPHAVKAGARALSSATTFGLANPIVSAIEDGLAISLAVLAFVVPVLTVLIVLLLAYFAVRWMRNHRARRYAAAGSE